MLFVKKNFKLRQRREVYKKYSLSAITNKCPELSVMFAFEYSLPFSF